MTVVEVEVWDEYFPEEDSETESSLGDVILAMEVLTERQKFVIECRFGLRPGVDGEALTLEEIASLMGVTYQAVQHIEARALAALRRSMKGL